MDLLNWWLDHCIEQVSASVISLVAIFFPIIYLAMSDETLKVFSKKYDGRSLCPWCNKFPHGSHEMQSWCRKARICKHILTARQRLDELLLERDISITLALWVWSTSQLVLARQAHKLAAVSMSLMQCARRQSFWKHRLQTIATLSDCMISVTEADASGLVGQTLRVQQQAAPRSWRAWLEENTTAGAPAHMTRHQRTRCQGTRLFPHGHWAGVRCGTTKDTERAAGSGNWGPDWPHHAHWR